MASGDLSLNKMTANHLSARIKYGPPAYKTGNMLSRISAQSFAIDQIGFQLALPNTGGQNVRRRCKRL